MNNRMLDSQNHRQKPLTTIQVDFLFLDLNTCTRCVSTNKNLEKAIDQVSDLLTITGVELNINKVLIDSEITAQNYKFVTSPTIRVNGHDIALETKESKCDSCTDLCGCEEGTNCRVWVYRGVEYTEAPVAMIVEALLYEIYGNAQIRVNDSNKYEEVPVNLKNFFAESSKNKSKEEDLCCDTEKQESCCEPSEKSTCCGESSSSNCGCQ